MARPRNSLPKIKDANGHARAWWGGRWHYFGPTGSEEASRRFNQFCKQILDKPNVRSLQSTDLLVSDLALRYVESLAGQVGEKAIAQARRACCLLCEMHGDMPIGSLGAVAVDSWRKWLASDTDGAPNLNVTTIRYYVGVVKDMLSWSVRTELLTLAETKLESIRELKPMPRNSVRGPRRVLPVEDELIEKTLPFLLSPVAAMVQIQRFTGMRPTEVMSITPEQIHRSGRVTLSSGLVVDLDQTPGVWVYVPHHHKTQARGKFRDVPIGPRAQAVLLPFLNRGPKEFCFSPKEALAELRERQKQERLARGGGSGGNKKKPRARSRKVNDRYSGDSYGRAIAQACERGGLPHWHPYKLRHTAGTEARTRGGLGGASALLGHDHQETTLGYAERNFQLAVKLVVESG